MIITYETPSTLFTENRSLYVNMTNQCNNRCTFCHRFGRENPDNEMPELWLESEPKTEVVIEEVLAKNPGEYDEIVFCGYGEPSFRLADILDIARAVKERFEVPLRMNTNGLCALIYNEDMTASFDGLIDCVSISLNAPDATSYNALCRPPQGNAYEEILRFANNASRYTKVYMTVLDLLSEAEITKCEQVAKSCGAELRVRKYLA